MYSHVLNSRHTTQGQGLMASYIIDIRKEVPLEADQLKKDAKEELDKSTKDDKVLRDTVSSWKRDNRKWLMLHRKCEKSKERGEPSKTNSGKDRWLENLARDLKPTTNPRDDGDLKAMKSWKQAMQTYTEYIKKEFELAPKLY